MDCLCISVCGSVFNTGWTVCVYLSVVAYLTRDGLSVYTYLLWHDSTRVLLALQMTSSPSYKLIYFNARGKAEHIRFIFAYAGVEFEDERIPRDKWPQVKKSKHNTFKGVQTRGPIGIFKIDGKVTRNCLSWCFKLLA
jgi:hypothetical protein